MTVPTPYTYIRCPCSDQTSAGRGGDSKSGKMAAEEEGMFDPRDPRSSYSLYPLEYLLFCEDCQQIRCPRCVTEESVTYYCPNCLFEVPSSNLRSEGNRCTRSCYQCPVCIGPLQVGAVQPVPDPTNPLGLESRPANPNGGPFALFCQYCNWTSSEIGIEFERPSGIYSQLSKINNGGQPKLTAREVKERRKENPDEPPVSDDQLDADLQFSNLKSFYQAQLADANSAIGSMGAFSSPAALSRIMSLYTGGRGHAGRLPQGPPDVMREAAGTDDGLKVANLDESAAVAKLMAGGWDAAASVEQRGQQLQERQARFQDELRPIPYLLRSKRSKRCPACRHIISKPEAKVTSTRFKIRLVAKSYIPTITIRPFAPTAKPVPVTYRPGAEDEAPLRPHRPCQFILTFKNPIFESIRVTLATPNTTPGRFSSRVTVLCPQFEVDANTDMWDDALKDDERDRDAARRGPGGGGDDGAAAAAAGPEVGKIWEKGRNWVSIVLEVIPPSLRLDDLPRGEHVDRGPLRKGEDVLEIPMLVRMEWEADTTTDGGAGAVGGAAGGASGATNGGLKEKRELAYWCVLGVGRISHE
ncbi:Dynactin subunit 4 [Escovopsis weberi]|uniref:Dynactin subunit 4 n=1 Tax=Escovopsis weberi TaxID=150374 RepID=A0A0M9VTT9_ESCWE|nr:Dynactin subunit 4 [Escovopsis weberi]